jgi:hypothetical protein
VAGGAATITNTGAECIAPTEVRAQAAFAAADVMRRLRASQRRTRRSPRVTFGKRLSLLGRLSDGNAPHRMHLPREEAMLFHVVMTHTADNCPAFNTERMPALIESLEKLEKVGEEVGVKAHALLWGAPDHVAFAVLEADDLVALGRFLNSIAIVQDFEITPVQNVADVVKFGRAAMARAAK